MCPPTRKETKPGQRQKLQVKEYVLKVPDSKNSEKCVCNIMGEKMTLCSITFK